MNIIFTYKVIIMAENTTTLSLRIDKEMKKQM